MNRKELEEFLFDNQDYITGMSVNDYFYHVDYVLDFNLEFDNETVLNCYEIEYKNECLQVIETKFTMSDLLGMKKLEFYRYIKI